MEFGICDLSVAPLRAEPTDKSEIISQILFGETYKVTAIKPKWIKIKMAYDGYEGWLDEKQHLPIKKNYYDKLIKEPASVSLDIVNMAMSSDRQVPIVIGSNLPDFDGMNFKIKKEKFVYSGQAITLSNHYEYDKIIEKCVLRYLNAPYQWGGRSPFGIDCSGFTQMVYKLIGITLKRDSYQQAGQGKTIDFIDTLRDGDLAFFENNEKKITHVGIILKGSRIIHASGKVRIDKLDHYGIYNEKTKKYTHKLKIIKRLI